MRWQTSYIAILLCLLCHSCGGCYDHRLMVPDGGGGGHILTPFGCLVYGPWEIGHDIYNKAVYWEGKEISSAGVDYSPLQQDLVFELLQDGSVQFWFKHDYDSSLTTRTSPDASGVRSITNERPADSDIKKVYKTGTWKVDFRDSSLTIDFGKENGIPLLKGKYKNLTSTYFDFQEISYFDSTYLGNKKRLQMAITTYYTHPWINKF